jgi:hypothetical protein
MLIEAFSEAKDPSSPHTNEDRVVILPGRAYAVIDGVTDRLGTRYDGALSGQYAAMIVKGALEHLLSAPGELPSAKAIVEALTDAISRVYTARGMSARVRSDWNLRLSAALALAVVREATIEIILVGDSGVRLNGTEILLMEKDLDLITSTLRRVAWPIIGRKISDPALREQISRRVTWHGTRQPLGGLDGALGASDVALIEELALQANIQALPHVPKADIENLVTGGIVNAQGGYQNDASTMLGYPCVDGFEVPESLIRIENIPRSSVQSIEIFSDGYFKPGEGFGVAAWEKAFAEVERDDPAKVVLYSSPKGSIGDMWADDRTYLGIRFDGLEMPPVR